METSSVSGRILAIDFGLVRLGLAVSDALGLTAQGLETIQRTNKQSDLRLVEEVVAQYSPAKVLVGNPVSHSGGETEMSQKAVRFAEQLRSVLDVPVEMWDERFTSAEADRALHESGLGRAKRRQSRDRIAAQILLQSYLDRRAYERGDMGAQARP